MRYRIPICLCIGFLWLLIMPRLAQAATYYVATSGNDNNNGGISTPFRTVQHGVDALSAGDILYLRGGTYTETAYRNGLNGTAQNLITISGYQNETAIVDGNHAGEPLLLDHGSNFVIQNLTLINGSQSSSHGFGYNTLLIANSNNVRVNNIEVYGTNGQCDGGSAQIMIHFSTYVIIENSRIHDSNFQPNSGNTNCGGIGMMGGYGTGLGNIVIQNNTIYNMPRGTAIWDKHPGYGIVEIAYNTIYNVHNASYIRQRDVHFHHNRIYNITNTETDPTMRIFNEGPDPVNRNIHVEYNTFATCPYSAILYTSGTNITLNNNIYYQCTETRDKRTYTICEYANNCASGANITEIHSDNNCIYYTPTSLEFLRYRSVFYSLAQARQQFGLDINSTFTNPQFLSTDPQNSNFLRPSPGNSCESMGAFANNPNPPSCTESWSCGAWSTCSGGNQTRTCTDTNSCGTIDDRPALNQSCSSPSCTESWSCGAWSTCSGGNQTRTCTDANACGTTTDRPALSQSCQIAPSCLENWSCTNWSSCTNGSQTRSCTDANACGTTTDQPSTTYACSIGNEAPQSGDTINPNTQITAGPPAILASHRPEFRWTGVDDTTATDSLTYSYRLDNQEWSGWSSATSITFPKTNNGLHTFSVRARDNAGNIDETPATVSFIVRKEPYIVTGAKAGATPRVRVFDRTGKLLSDFYAFEKTFKGGVAVAMGDLGTDGTDEIIVGSGPGRRSEVRVFRRDGSLIGSFYPYSASFRGGITVATGDINNDGRDEIITGAGPGARPYVRVFQNQNGTFRAIISYNLIAYNPTFKGGVFVASLDSNGDGRDELVTAPGAGGRPTLSVFSTTNNKFTTIQTGLLAYSSTFRGGANISGGNINSTAAVELITGAGPGARPYVRIFDYRSNRLTLLNNGFMAFAPQFRGGVSISAADINLDGIDEIITAVGSNGEPLVRIWTADGRTILRSFYAYSRSFKGGVTVAAGE